MIFVTADHHFKHRRIIELCSRPFHSLQFFQDDVKLLPDVELMDRTLVRLWNDTVKPEDVVWHLGDFSLGPRSAVRQFAEQLNGKKFFVRGNHDHSWKTYLEAGFLPLPEIQKVGPYLFKLSHRPPTQTHAEDWCKQQGAYWLHGHSHGKNPWRHPKVFDVGVDCRDFKPMSLGQIVGGTFADAL
jgi:calcineurin-like phosphoesterase family protein